MTRAKRLAVLGSTGQIGRQVVALAASRALDVVGLARTEPNTAGRFDLAEPASIRATLLAVRPTHILLAAALTSVVRCEQDPAGSARVNVAGSLAVADVARELGARLVFISTDYVFDGAAGPYDERTAPNPINEYGRQKRAVEVALEGASDALVVRTCQVFGRDPRRANYVLQVADAVRAGRPVRAATDLFGTPTFAPDLAPALLDLALGAETGYRHIAGDAFVSRYELAVAVATAFGASPSLIEPVDFAQVDDGVPRPRLSGLRSIAPFPMTSLQNALATMLGAERS